MLVLFVVLCNFVFVLSNHSNYIYLVTIKLNIDNALHQNLNLSEFVDVCITDSVIFLFITVKLL